MEYYEGALAVRKTFGEVLMASGIDEALEAGRRMADWLGMDPAVADAVADEWEDFRRRAA